MEYFTFDEVVLAYYDCRKRKRKTVNASLFELELEDNLYLLWEDLNNETYEIGKSICFLIRYPKLREVFAATFRDRIVHHIIINRLEDLFEKEFIFNTYNCRKGKGVLFGVNCLSKAINRSSGSHFIFKFDFSGFFMSIDKTLLYNKLERFILEKYTDSNVEVFLRLIKKVVMHCPEKHCIRKGHPSLWSELPKNKSLFTTGYNFGLPIGNLTSLIFANFYLSEFDHIMDKLCRFYCRYVDDFIVITAKKDEFLKAIPKMLEYLMTHNVKLNPKKTYVQHISKGCTFVGSTIKPHIIYPGRRCVTHIYDSIRKFELNNFPEDKVFMSLNSYFGYFQHNTSFNIKKKIVKLVDGKWNIKVHKSYKKFIKLC